MNAKGHTGYVIKGHCVKMAELKLKGKKGEGKVALVDDADYPELSQYDWYLRDRGYVERPNDHPTKGRWGCVLLHRAIMNPPKGAVVDHANGNKLDNRRCNLRVCDQSRNKQNAKRRTDSSSPYKGVFLSKGRWAATIGVKGKRVYLGRYDSPELAAAAYNAGARFYFGEYALLNPVEGDADLESIFKRKRKYQSATQR